MNFVLPGIAKRKESFLYSMMLKGLFILLLFADQVAAQSCSDTAADDRTKMFFKQLLKLQERYTVFGHQDALAYGVGWKGISGNSDVKAVTGDYPGLYGWDIGHLEMQKEANLDNVSFRDMKKYIREGFERGGIITISWHLRNPLTGGSAWDTAKGTVASVLPGGNRHEIFKTWLDQVAGFMHDLKDKYGKPIPVLFRPFHELTGNWFWWCKNVCTPDEFKALWRFTVSYLREQKKVHHLLYVYNTAGFTSESDFMASYPGDDMVDVVSFDQYQHKTGTGADRQGFIDDMKRKLTILCQVASRRNKIAALAETGLETVPDRQWWTAVLWPVIKDFSLAYVLVWRNHGYMPSIRRMHYYAPYPGQQSAQDFKKMTKYPRMLLEKGIRKINVYQ